MEDKEKAEEYANGIEYYDKVYSDISNGYTIVYDKDQLMEAVMYGLAEGRKEATEENFKEAYQKYVNNSLATFDMKKALEDARDQIRLAKENEKLKAQIPQWHNLAENPNDLPKENCECWCYVEYLGYKQHRKVYYNGEWEADIKVIAWYGLPMFE